MKQIKEENEWEGPVARVINPLILPLKSSVSLEIFLLVCPGGSYRKRVCVYVCVLFINSSFDCQIDNLQLN